jgi:acyl-coenzyme A synthetase/AMP-(fatty) acid ligase
VDIEGGDKLKKSHEDGEIRLVYSFDLLRPLGEKEGQLAAIELEERRRSAEACDVCYTLFTSGSTGRPKGVRLTHEGVVTLINDPIFSEALNEQTRMAQLGTFQFDASVFEIFGALLKGGCLIIDFTLEDLLMPTNLADKLTHYRITCANLSTSIFHLLAVHAPSALCSLELLLFGGEQGDLNLINLISSGGDEDKKYRPKLLINGYGPTECTVYSSYEILDSVPKEHVFIGHPAGNTFMFLLGPKSRQLVPIGVEGEIVIGGNRVFAGYIGADDTNRLDDSRFVLYDQLCDDVKQMIRGIVEKNERERESTVTISEKLKDMRFYFTNDIARQNIEGKFEFLYRIDRQVKVNSVRVELGEVETVIMNFNSVQRCVVTTMKYKVEKEVDITKLVGFVIPKSQFNLQTFENYLTENLPRSLVPVIVLVEEFMYNMNGKIDVPAMVAMNQHKFRFSPSSTIPTHDEVDVNSSSDPMSFRNVLLAVTNAWESILHYSQLDVNCSFFSQGGSSLLIGILVQKLNQKFSPSVSVTLPLVFSLSTIMDQAKYYFEILGKSDDNCTSSSSSTCSAIESEVRLNCGREQKEVPAKQEKRVVVIGMSGRFSGSENLTEFWRSLRMSNSGIADIPYFGTDANFVNRKGVLPQNTECFDATYFGYVRSVFSFNSPICTHF